ncbi:MAG: Mu transposase C-terminal domain-containing protein [Roseburia inulinivorans]
MDIGGGRIDFWNDDFVHLMLGKKVYFRYDPENLSEVRIYDLEDRYIMSVPADNTAVLSYNASKDDVKAADGEDQKAGAYRKGIQGKRYSGRCGQDYCNGACA